MRRKINIRVDLSFTEFDYSVSEMLDKIKVVSYHNNGLIEQVVYFHKHIHNVHAHFGVNVAPSFCPQ